MRMWPCGLQKAGSNFVWGFYFWTGSRTSSFKAGMEMLSTYMYGLLCSHNPHLPKADIFCWTESYHFTACSLWQATSDIPIEKWKSFKYLLHILCILQLTGDSSCDWKINTQSGLRPLEKAMWHVQKCTLWANLWGHYLLPIILHSTQFHDIRCMCK